MLEIYVEPQEFLNEETNEIIRVPGAKLKLEHSLISIKKWESKWHKPFLGNGEKTNEELLDYIRCMSLTSNIDPLVFQYLPPHAMVEIINYIKDPMTASWFNTSSIGASNFSMEIITNEIIYYWMIKFGVPFECQKWHIEQLLALIKTISIKDAPSKKMSKQEELAQRKALNAKRRAQMKSKG